ncbi:sodium bicarbonate cotransporter 3-like isoform X2 [Dendronephthya gigantea]|uniref:sodium bicarbonate cotransporter 3-like isoform X2 n=1 Tax=Dendronephthya gigantea TaxID=151771 RepID=UPI00106AE313|nr:sodium bicarbonate cotransporter 3-like isoform X2 [Dendronephthya gigantea]
MFAKETIGEDEDGKAESFGNQTQFPSTGRRPRTSSLLQRLGEESDTPYPVEQYSIPVDETEIKDHRQVYVGVHIPIKPSRARRNHHRSHHYPSVSKNKPGRSNSTKNKPQNGAVGHQAPADRVRFILGGDDNDVERQIFTEMDELCCDAAGEEEWKETARWLKFEEDVEEGGNRWSKPHVATLSLYSLFELRSCVLNGTVLLDLNATTISQIADIVLDDLVATRQLDVCLRPRVRDILLKKHRHLYERRKSTQKRKTGLPSLRGTRKSSATLSNMDKADNLAKSSSASRLQDLEKSDSNFQNLPTAVSLIAQDLANDDVSNDSDPECSRYDANFMKKIPQGAEGSMVLVGETDFLSKPMNAFVRLEDAVILGDIMEVPLPTRFLFFMLGPSGQPGRYHEVGRAIATLMADEVFHDVAFKATCREDITAGIDEFLQQVTVLPPGEWDPSIRIEPPATVPSQENRRVQQYTSDGGRQGRENSLGAKGGGVNGGGGDESGDDRNNELIRTGRFGGGLIMDIKRRIKCYKSDFVDALNSQCLASVLFIYFACLAPIVTFGGVMETKTNRNMGAMEQLLAASIGGVLFSLFSGQPLTILGATGPMLVFEEILYNFCDKAELDYMPFRLWIGLWTTFYCLVLVVTDCSALVRYFTRFTEESFATLIGLIFIYEGGNKLYELAGKYPVPNDHVVEQSCECIKSRRIFNNITKILTTEYYSTNKTIYDCDPNNQEIIQGNGCGGAIFLLSTILTLGTFFLVLKLKSFKTSRFFPTKVRKVVSDFAVIISVIVMVGVDAALKVSTPKLNIPTNFQPTNADARGWLIAPLGKNPWWTLIAASIPALLTTILVFMDQQITAVIVNKREHKLKKGAGYHLDLTVVAIGIGICSILGLPWVVAATVLSLAHVQSLFVESTCTAPGERPKFLGVREQRVTGTLVFLMVGLTVFLGKFLKYIPMPVLYGLFIYMGVSALKGVQFFERMKILFMPIKHQPDRVYLRKVRISRIHIFTGIQMTCLIILWVIKATPAAISFPLMVLALVAVRKVMDKIFTKQELEVLDDVVPESMKRIIEEADEVDEGSLESPAKLVHNDSGINISEELKNCTIWKVMEGNQQTDEASDEPREHKTPKRKHKHKNRHKHKHRHRRGNDYGYERKLSTVTDKPDLEILANEEDEDSPAIPLVTLTTFDEHDAKKDPTTESDNTNGKAIVYG